MITTVRDLSNLQLADAVRCCVSPKEDSCENCPLETGNCGGLWNEVDKRFYEVVKENAELREANERNKRMVYLAVKHEAEALKKLDEIAAIIVR